MLLIVPGDSGDERQIPLDGAISIGQGSHCVVSVRGPGVADEHIRIERGVITALSPCSVGDVELAAGGRRLAVAGHEIVLGPIRMRLEQEQESVSSPSVPTRQLALRAAARIRTDPTVVVVEGPNVGEERTLAPDTGPLTIGRSQDAGLPIDLGTLSRGHVRVSRRGHEVLIEDLGSAHGTWLGSARLAPNRVAVWPSARMVRLGPSVVLAIDAPVTMKDVLGPAMSVRVPAARAISALPAVDVPLPVVPDVVAATRPRSNTRARNVVVVVVLVLIAVGGIASLIWLFIV